jgi:hypothetical protein
VLSRSQVETYKRYVSGEIEMSRYLDLAMENQGTVFLLKELG